MAPSSGWAGFDECVPGYNPWGYGYATVSGDSGPCSAYPNPDLGPEPWYPLASTARNVEPTIRDRKTTTIDRPPTDLLSGGFFSTSGPEPSMPATYVPRMDVVPAPAPPAPTTIQRN